MPSNRLLLAAMLLLLAACGNDDATYLAGNAQTTPATPALNQRTEDLTPLSDAEYAALSDIQKFALANKLAATLYRGMATNELIDLTAGLHTINLRNRTNLIAQMRAQLGTRLDSAARAAAVTRADAYSYYVNTAVNANTKFFDSKAMMYPLATIYEFPTSLDAYARWMAYVLANTILFSPALELDSVRSDDIANVYNRLVDAIEAGRPVREIVYDYMVSQENWHRFRSPEDNTREMMEIFLNRFIDAEVPKAATACKNWRISGYTLVKTGAVNTQPQQILDTVVVSCENFYRAVADHDDLMPTVATVLINTFFTDTSVELKRKLVASLLATRPISFSDMFSTILFSKEFLLFSAQPRRAEETVFNVAARLGWRPAPAFFDQFADAMNPTPAYVSLWRLGQAPYRSKLGRNPRAPTDTLNFSLHHKLLRERVLLNTRAGTDVEGWDDGLFSDTSVQQLGRDDFLHYLFLSVLSRKATDTELSTLNQVILNRAVGNRRREQALIVLDYFSRLPELYSTPAIVPATIP